MSICPRCKTREKYKNWAYCKQCSNANHAESRKRERPEGKTCKHNESRPDGPAQEMYDAMVKNLQEKYAAKFAEIRAKGYDPVMIDAGEADKL